MAFDLSLYGSRKAINSLVVVHILSIEGLPPDIEARTGNLHPVSSQNFQIHRSSCTRGLESLDGQASTSSSTVILAGLVLSKLLPLRDFPTSLHPLDTLGNR